MSFKDFVVWILIGLVLFLFGCWAINHYWISLSIIAALAAIVGGLLSVRVVRWYIYWAMARADFFFTEVPEAHFKVVTRFGGHKKTLLNKKDYKLAEEDVLADVEEVDNDGNKKTVQKTVVWKGDIVPLAPGEQAPASLPGGLFFVGWPGIDRVYSTEMKFVKSVSNGVKAYAKPEDSFYAKVDYPYAIVFEDCEDKSNLPLKGYATLLANVTGPGKSLFATANFYETMERLVLPSIRECLKAYSYDNPNDPDDKGTLRNISKDVLDEKIWAVLHEKNPRSPTRKDGSQMSVVDQLREDYGVEIVALRIVNIDPASAELRKLTLIKYLAERQADAAQAVARKEAEETEGRVVEAVARANGMTRKELEEKLKANPKLKGQSAIEGGFKEDFAHARDLLKRDRAGDGLEDIRIGNVDGTQLEPVAGVIGALLGLKQRQGARRKRGSSATSSKDAATKKDAESPPRQRTQQELEDDIKKL